jgi:hypothetical protein
VLSVTVVDFGDSDVVDENDDDDDAAVEDRDF